ncbi:hypothetical protein BJG92_01491 [Arthrobacter sp. SO5]|uniref:hypothetical protein n=1 Tax=Arthrobacter sp. SO5 TaxID=1897055 RepID=UPI001E527D13|nr:hypothetical protein [Arthrobacter sp. SO5]MCB5273965.1 hypothetical protein [Arthrobacter sp. SO5]
MDSSGSLPIQPARDSLESDPAYDYAEDTPVGAAETGDEELLEEAERSVPLDVDDFLGEDQPVVPLDGEGFLEPEEYE